MNKFWTWMDEPSDEMAGVGGEGATIALYVMVIIFVVGHALWWFL